MREIWVDDDLSPGTTTPQTWIVTNDRDDYITEIGGGEVIGIDPDTPRAAVPTGPMIPSERPASVPSTPAVSSWLYTAAIAVGLYALLGGRSRR